MWNESENGSTEEKGITSREGGECMCLYLSVREHAFVMGWVVGGSFCISATAWMDGIAGLFCLLYVVQ